MKINFVSAAFSIAAAAVLTLAGAWFFQLVIGLSPCPLCLDQRVPYYVAVPLALGVASLAQNETLARIGFYVLAFVLAIAFALAVWAMAAQAQDAARPGGGVTVQPRLDLMQTWTDNLRLDTHNKDAALITTVSPGISLVSNSGTLRGSTAPTG